MEQQIQYRRLVKAFEETHTKTKEEVGRCPMNYASELSSKTKLWMRSSPSLRGGAMASKVFLAGKFSNLKPGYGRSIKSGLARLRPPLLTTITEQQCSYKKRSPPTQKTASAGAVGVPGFEPGTPWSQTRCATGLRYTPNIIFNKPLSVKRDAKI